MVPIIININSYTFKIAKIKMIMQTDDLADNFIHFDILLKSVFFEKEDILAKINIGCEDILC